MILSAFAPLGTVSATAASNDAPSDDIDELIVSVDDNVVTVESNETAVENATVNVTPTDENTSYAVDDTTDADGTVDLPEPEETVNVTVKASYENASGEVLTDETETTLEPEPEGLALSVEQNGDVTVTVTDNGTAVSNATVDVSTVDENVSYTDAGTHTTDENGTVTLDAPFGNESVEVAITATVDDESVETTTTLEPAEYDTFGSLVSAFVGNAQDDSDGPLGLTVANFVLEHNPGNAPEHAGPPSHAGPPGDGDETKDNQGPPAHAGGPSGEADDAEEVDEDAEGDEDADSSPGNGGGPPSHAGPN
ncbi:hypothetical protein [Natronorubrum sulfidifaciens]|uniref:Uncharacterized protein n=1 Tax=Natronorubrum sulfidifaciens JCM 14089 TaxID=1230460 RepID=L9WAG3_9EURY|nr:hypothetical protein [Natronorubrum sulfidifaciens]ELY46266.1 hypothetical protein C495_06828 [Natronorubrum sulfidifaciens JCM 14089]